MSSERESPEVATHVLVPVTVAEQLRALSKKTRIAQSEFLREAVEDLLRKYSAHTLGLLEAPSDDSDESGNGSVGA
ncbi:MAG: ribbon-helix-helix domain-containing protein [Myxococcales bacterium]|jgi:class 3 adenylate cyclase|nr:ribbon-helix-helix domain-containing protein [Myxococcales bacterium]